MQERIKVAFVKTSKVLNAPYLKRKRTLLFQKVMWGLMGIYRVLILALLGLQNVPALNTNSWRFLNVFEATTTNPYASLYPIIGLVILLYPTTIF